MDNRSKNSELVPDIPTGHIVALCLGYKTSVRMTRGAEEEWPVKNTMEHEQCSPNIFTYRLPADFTAKDSGVSL